MVFCETEGGALRKGSRQAIGAARQIPGSELEALLIGKDSAEIGAKMGEFGVKKVIAVPHDGDYSTAIWTAAAHEAVGDGGDCLVLASHTAIARDFTPRLGARLNCAQITDVIDITDHEAGENPYYQA